MSAFECTMSILDLVIAGVILMLLWWMRNVIGFIGLAIGFLFIALIEGIFKVKK